VISVGFAVALLAVGHAAEHRGGDITGDWIGIGYAPLTAAPTLPFFVRHPGWHLLLWLVLIAVWVAVSLSLFRSRPGPIATPPVLPDPSGQPDQAA